ncbi:MULTISPECIES: YpiF family protein [Bacillaceae]|uniref:YpiF family protein n=1 Tax=Evansella alkalicola TaxID=745819 RepID=A0ABS6JZP4_9BACI|nr:MULTISPECIES: YpiF family protein [Bacillaceae]MBU9723933.1 YpiF family protein [Bacillus alkalicola]
MKWTTEQMDMYLKAKEYVDTAIIPLIPVDLLNDPKGKVSMGEFTTVIVDEIERQFRGRVFQIPAFTYVVGEKEEEKLQRLKDWDKHLFSNGFKHILYITSDSEWRKVENELPDMLIWIPSLSLESMEDKYAKEIIDQQMKQLLPLVTNKWQDEPKERL